MRTTLGTRSRFVKHSQWHVTNTEQSNKRNRIVPILYELPTASTVILRNICNTIQIHANQATQITIVFGEAIPFAEVSTLLEKYLLEYGYYAVIFAGATSKEQSTRTQERSEETRSIEELETLTHAENQAVDFDVEIRTYVKGNKEAVYKHCYASDLEGVKTASIAVQKRTSNRSL